MMAGQSIRPPEISESTPEQRRDYIVEKFHCISDCDSCGICTVFHGKDPEDAYRDYIEGIRSFWDVSADFK